MIEVENLTVTFGSGARAVRAVRGISFSVAAGASFGLGGEGGAGKSTVLRDMAGLHREWCGALAVGGQSAWRQLAKAS